MNGTMWENRVNYVMICVEVCGWNGEGRGVMGVLVCAFVAKDPIDPAVGCPIGLFIRAQWEYEGSPAGVGKAKCTSECLQEPGSYCR
jgi:hypothetical protein